MEEKNTEKFGLFTTIAMIVGIVVGSGIFFKADDILISANGSPFIGALILTVGAVGIVFGGLCVSTYARKNSAAGGLITYIEMAFGDTAGYLAGWFQTIFYYPAIIAILSWIGAVYFGMMFGIKDTKDIRIWIASGVIILGCYGLNILNTYLAGKFQNITVSIKMVILFLIAVLGFVFGKPSNIISNVPLQDSITSSLFVGLIASAFSYDGWFVAPSIAHEIKNPKKNLTKALIISPLIILGIYLLYFLGITYYLGADNVMQLGDASIGTMANQLFGHFGETFIYVAIIISILGTVNGLILGYIRLPYSLAIRGRFPKSTTFNTLNDRFDIPVPSAILSFILVISWLCLHALSVYNISFMSFSFGALQVDNLPIVLTYFFYVLLYIRLIINFIKSKEEGIAFGLIYPLLAIIGAGLVIYGGITQPGVLLYFLISFIGIFVGYLLMKK